MRPPKVRDQRSGSFLGLFHFVRVANVEGEIPMSSGEASASGQPTQILQEQERGSLLSNVLKHTKETTRDSVKSALKVIVDEVMSDAKVFDKNTIRTLDRLVKQLDAKLTKQLRAVMHHEKFSRLEGSWRGLKYFVSNTETATDLQIKVMSATKSEVTKDLENASEFDQSTTFQKIYRDEFGQAGGHPFAAIVGDYEIENNADDIDMLTKMSQVASAAFCPFLTSPAPSMFQFDNWTALPDPRDLALTFTGPKYVKWNAFRESEDSRFVGMAFPRTLARDVYGNGGKKVEEFDFQEADLDADGTPTKQSHEQFCWASAAYALATRLTAAYSQTGFCTRILSMENGGGKVEDLPVFAYRDADGSIDMKCPTEMLIDDRRANELAKLGFIPLINWKRTNVAAFITGDTVQKPKVYDRAQANENAQASAWLPYILATGRLTHYVKSFGRDMLGSFQESEDIEKRLNNWINNYVCLDASPSEESKASLPLKEAKVEVKKVPGKAGAFTAKVWMRPWTMMRELTAAMSIVTNIPKQGG